MPCPSCGTQNVVGALTCVVCGGALPQEAVVAQGAPMLRPEILRARRPTPLAPPPLEGLPLRGDPQDRLEAQVREPAVGPPSSDPAPALSGHPHASRTYIVEPGAPAPGRVLVAGLVDGMVALAPAAVVASFLAPDRPAAEGLLTTLVEALLLTPACTMTLIITGTALHTLHLGLTLPRFGATLGGSVFGLGLRTRSGEVPSAVRATVRGLVGAITAFAFLAGPLYALWVDVGRRTLGDLVARTMPVRHRLGGASADG